MFMLTHLCSVFKTQWSFSTFFHTMLCKITLCTSLSYALMVLASNILETSTSPPTVYLKIYKVFCSRCALVFDVCVTFESPAIPHLCQNTKKVKWALVHAGHVIHAPLWSRTFCSLTSGTPCDKRSKKLFRSLLAKSATISVKSNFLLTKSLSCYVFVFQNNIEIFFFSLLNHISVITSVGH